MDPLKKLDSWFQAELARPQALERKVCAHAHCQKVFVTTRTWQVYCSGRCRHAWRKMKSVEHLRRMDEQRDMLEAELECALARIEELEKLVAKLR